jgi:DNA-binding NarL/FixJ family response regulator
VTARVLVVDDQAMVRAGFAALLDAQPDIVVVGQAADGEEGVRLAAETLPDVVLMDVRMPVLDGIEATKAMLAPGRPLPLPKIVMLTTFDVDDYVLDALRAGASGFLLKDALPDDLVEAVRIVARGDALLAPSVTRRLIERFAGRPTGTTAIGSDLDVLTDREREVLREVAQGRSNSEIAGVLFIAEQTVKSHVSRVLTKLGLRDRAQAVVVAYEAGLVVPGD